MKLEELNGAKNVAGVIDGETVDILAASLQTSGLTLVFFQTESGGTSQTFLTPDQVQALTVTHSSTQMKFSANPMDYKLAHEAYRMQLAGLFDPLVAVNSSDLQPLPHQIKAVYGEFLPRIPLRFLLADDPGAGKTIMAGLYIKELILRGYLKRCLIVVPGGLIDQWRQELLDKFSLNFDQLTKPDLDAIDFANPFSAKDFLIARMDQLSRANPEVENALDNSRWDLIIVDESHRMSAYFSSWRGQAKETKRFRLGKRLSKITTNLLLMTATPHAGNEENFQLFLSLLDEDRFEGKKKSNTAKIDTSDVMRRLVKEDLVDLQGRALFPERRAQTVEYLLSSEEKELYEAVTTYVRQEMNRAAAIAAKGDKKRSNNVGFALTILQRRLASSPRAILRSLERRQERLASWLRTLETESRLVDWKSPEISDDFDFDDEEIYEEYSPEEIESAEETSGLDLATAAQTVEELKAELATLGSLVEQARHVNALDEDKKWTELRSILSDNLDEISEDASSRKFIVFTEHKDTLYYLTEKIANLYGDSSTVVSIHGGHSRDERNRAKESFTQDPNVRVLVATDAAGEGLNLQRAHLMVNYDLPWNPNRIEQRFGRIHRIGQTEVCWLWNLVAVETREGEVFKTLLDKIELQSEAYNGNIFNVLGQGKPFNEKSLRDLLQDAVKYGNDPEVRAQRNQVIVEGVEASIRDIQADLALTEEMRGEFNPSEIARQYEEVQIRRLQPGFISGFFTPAFERIAGQMKSIPAEPGRFRITRVPESLIKLSLKNSSIGPVASEYERVTFEREKIRMESTLDAHLIAPGSPIMNAVIRKTLDDLRYALKDGTIIIDRTDKQGNQPTLLVSVVQTVKNALEPPVDVDRHFNFIEVSSNGEVAVSKIAPYIDYSNPSESEREYVLSEILPKLDLSNLDDIAKGFSVSQLMSKDFGQLRQRISDRVDKIRKQVESRLDGEIDFWSRRALELRSEPATKSSMRPEEASKKAKELENRKQSRLAELKREESLTIELPSVVARAIVIPEKLLVEALRSASDVSQFTKDQDAIKAVERRAVDMVVSVEKARGREPEEQARNNKGFDIISRPKDSGESIFIEVKGRIEGADTFLVTTSEVQFGQNEGIKHLLAMVKVSPNGPEFDEVRYVSSPFDNLQVSIEEASKNLYWQKYWDRGYDPRHDGQE
jgi:SNF2 family DNA or RNA helicase